MLLPSPNLALDADLEDWHPRTGERQRRWCAESKGLSEVATTVAQKYFPN